TWYTLADALEHAKRGDFSLLTSVPYAMESELNESFWDAAAVLLGHAGPWSLLEKIGQDINFDDTRILPQVKAYFSEMLGYAMNPNYIYKMIEFIMTLLHEERGDPFYLTLTSIQRLICPPENKAA